MATVKLDPAKGVQIPNLTTTERNAISSPETGALIWNTTTSAINQYNGSAWEITYTDTNTQADITGKLNLSGGTMTGGLTVNAAAVFNETGADVDFRVEASGQDKAIIVNGATGYVGINTTGMAQAPLHILKTAGADTIVPLLILDSNIDSAANGKGGSIVFQDIASYANTAEISAARLGGGGSSEVKFKLRNTDVMALNSNGYVTTPLQPFFWGRVPNGTTKPAGWNSGFGHYTQVVVNRGSHYNTSNGNFTCPVAGDYEIAIGGFFSTASNGTRLGIEFRKNGTTFQMAGGQLSDGDTPFPFLRCIVNCSANDTLQAEHMYSPINVTTASGTYALTCQIRLLG